MKHTVALRLIIGSFCKVVGAIGIFARDVRFVRYYWLGHYLIGKGSSLILPKWMVKLDSNLSDKEYVKLMHTKVYNPKRINIPLYHCVGGFTVIYSNKRDCLCSMDHYDFHSRDGIWDMINVRIPNHIGALYQYLNDTLGLYNDYFTCYKFSDWKCRRRYYLSIYDNFWVDLNGTPFTTYIIYNYKEKV
jgi:hypothetical protein